MPPPKQSASSAPHQTAFPARTVRRFFPYTRSPANGVARPIDKNVSGSIRYAQPMAFAANTVVEHRGGIVVAADGQIRGEVVLEIAGIMSGGVDSAAAAILLRGQGFDVCGATMLLHDAQTAELDDARRSAEALGIPFAVFDLREDFARLVTRPFARAYQAGLTPNPCVVCNRTLKFGLFLDRALALGCEKIATGHYARLGFDGTLGRWLVRKAADAGKDQTYMEISTGFRKKTLCFTII